MDAFTGEIRAMPFSYNPQTWLYCDGSLLLIGQYQALASVLGTTYGGNGQTTFGLPDLRGRAALEAGQGPGLVNVARGGVVGKATQTVLNPPPHNHTFNSEWTNVATYGANFSDTPSNTSVPSRLYLKTPLTANETYVPNAPAASPTLPVAMATSMVTPWGAAAATPYDNHQPYLSMNYFICYDGYYPVNP